MKGCLFLLSAVAASCAVAGVFLPLVDEVFDPNECIWNGRQVDPSEKPVEAPKNMTLFLLAGQSNMAGRAPVPEADLQPLERTYKLNRDGRWVPATSPLHFDRAAAGMGPANGFAKAYLAAHPDETIGLVPCAVGGSGMATWIDGGEGMHGCNLRNALGRARIAAANGRFAAILWHQGECDATRADGTREKCVAVYSRRFRDMVARIRDELGEPDLPVIVGEIGRFWSARRKADELINPVLNALPDTVTHCACVSSIDLTPISDGLHFDYPSTDTLGRRYYAAYEILTAK